MDTAYLHHKEYVQEYINKKGIFRFWNGFEWQEKHLEVVRERHFEGHSYNTVIALVYDSDDKYEPHELVRGDNFDNEIVWIQTEDCDTPYDPIIYKLTDTIKLYERPENYMGEDYFSTFGVLGRNRDSDTFRNSLFDTMLEQATEMLNTQDHHLLQVISASHWAVGWVESLRVHFSAFEFWTFDQDWTDVATSYNDWPDANLPTEISWDTDKAIDATYEAQREALCEAVEEENKFLFFLWMNANDSTVDSSDEDDGWYYDWDDLTTEDFFTSQFIAKVLHSGDVSEDDWQDYEDEVDFEDDLPQVLFEYVSLPPIVPANQVELFPTQRPEHPPLVFIRSCRGDNKHSLIVEQCGDNITIELHWPNGYGGKHNMQIELTKDELLTKLEEYGEKDDAH